MLTVVIKACYTRSTSIGVDITSFASRKARRTQSLTCKLICDDSNGAYGTAFFGNTGFVVEVEVRRTVKACGAIILALITVIEAGLA